MRDSGSGKNKANSLKADERIPTQPPHSIWFFPKRPWITGITQETLIRAWNQKREVQRLFGLVLADLEANMLSSSQKSKTGWWIILPPSRYGLSCFDDARDMFQYCISNFVSLKECFYGQPGVRLVVSLLPKASSHLPQPPKASVKAEGNQ